MLSSQLASRYAQAIYELAAEQQELDAVEEQLSLVEKTLSSVPELGSLLYHPQVPVAAKKDTIAKVFGQQLSVHVRNFLMVLIDKRRETALPAIVKEFKVLANAARNITEAEITTAMPLSDSERQALSAKLSAVTGKRVTLLAKVDQRIVGGVIVKIGDKLIDGSVVRQLATLEAALLKTEVTKIGVTY
jgi:F-type H+-transporting ATPase subunit delta